MLAIFFHAGAAAVALAKFLRDGWKGWGIVKIVEAKCMQFFETQMPARERSPNFYGVEVEKLRDCQNFEN